jgi:ATP-dependent Clp protease protease subunit
MKAMARTKRPKPHDIDETRLWLESGVHVPSRKLRLMGGIDDDMAERIISGLDALLWQSHEPITVYMNTGGGDELPGLAIYDALKQSPAPITIQVVGTAHSMGAIILQAASRRVMGPSAAMMIHVGDRSYEGHAENVRREMLFDKNVDEICDRILLDRMRAVTPELTLGQLRDILTLDTYFDAHEAVAQGLADEVLK